ncbi:MAG TPA: hypothetical protein VJ302_11685, partial [Blastocatellia bacterium]|nr:hypothetical protein [Blastocatellia bacterium]
RVVVNTPSTHGAIGFSTALAPSMTLGCGSWGGNVTSDNISPLHLMDLKRVAFETRPVTSAPIQELSTPLSSPSSSPPSPQIDRETIAALVDRFLVERGPRPAPEPKTGPAGAPEPPPVPPVPMAAPAARPEPKPEPKPQPPAPPAPPAVNSGNGHRPAAVDFVCEEDVKRAIAKGEKIYINARTIITPSARDLGESREVFAKG